MCIFWAGYPDRTFLSAKAPNNDKSANLNTSHGQSRVPTLELYTFRHEFGKWPSPANQKEYLGDLTTIQFAGGGHCRFHGVQCNIIQACRRNTIMNLILEVAPTCPNLFFSLASLFNLFFSFPFSIICWKGVSSLATPSFIFCFTSF